MNAVIIEAARELISKNIDQLFTMKDKSAEERCRIAQQLIDDYWETTGEYPPSRMLERLATYILHADKTKRYKVKDAEYKVLSTRQIKARKEREIHLKELPNRDKKKINVQITRMGKEKYCQDSF